MKIPGYRSSLRTLHRWGRPLGDANGVVAIGVTEVPVLLVKADGGLTDVSLGPHADADRVFTSDHGGSDIALDDDALVALRQRRPSAASPTRRSRADWTPIATQSAWRRSSSCCGATRGGPR